MATFVVFYQKLLNNTIDTCISGDSEIKCDGRYSINTIIQKVFSRHYTRPREAIGFKIHVGTNYFNHRPCTQLYVFNRNIK